MDEKDWRFLQMLATEKNITKAAQKLYISQPALTSFIKQLERDFGCQLVIRRPRGIDFTTEGEILLDYAESSLQRFTELREALSNTGSEIRGTLRIGCSNIFSKYELPDKLKTFTSLNPKIEVNVRTGFSHYIYQLALQGGVHIGIVRGTYDWPGLKLQLCTEPYYVVSCAPIDMDKLPELPRIHYTTDAPLQTGLDSWWFSNYRRPPFIAMEVDTIDTCIQMVAKGLGYALLSGMCLQSFPLIHREALLLPDGSPLQRTTWLYCRESSLSISTVSAFVDFIKQHYSLT